jgi:hypothetical protein
VAHLQVSITPASARITLNGHRVEPDAQAELLADPGNLELEIRADGYEPALRHIHVDAGEHQELIVSLARAAGQSELAADVRPASTVAASKPKTHDTFQVLKWSTGAAAVLALGAGGVFLALQKSQANRFNGSCMRGMLTPACAELERSASAGGTWYTASIIGFSAGAALAATSAVFFVLDEANADRAERRAAAAQSCGLMWPAPGVACAFRF